MYESCNTRKGDNMSALLFFDIDGTLITLDKKHEMPESTKKALYKAKENLIKKAAENQLPKLEKGLEPSTY